MNRHVHIPEIAHKKAPEEDKDRPFLTVITAARLRTMEFPEPQWIIPGIIPEGLTIFAGRPKIGKSWLQLQCGIAKALGGMALGKIPVERCGVLYLALEDTLRRLQGRMTILGDEWPEGLAFQTINDIPLWRLKDGGEDRLREYLETNPETKLVMVDTFKKIRPARISMGNDYERDYEDMTILHGIAHEYTVGIIAAMHTRKSKAEDVFDEVSGTLGLTGAADTTLILGRPRGEADGILHVTGRDVAEQELALQKDRITQTWIIEGDAHEVAISKERREVLDLLHENGDPMQPKDIAKTLGKDGGATRKLLRDMHGAGQVTQPEVGKYTVPMCT